LYFGLSGGKQAEEINKIRLNEFDSFCIEEGFDYAHIIDSSVDLVNHIDESVDIIMLPSYVDWQTDHRLVNDIVIEYLKKSKLNPEIMLYNITVPLSDKFTNFVHPMNKKEQNCKYLMFSNHYTSQRSMPTKRFMYQERSSGKIINKYAGERFYILSLKEYLEILRVLNNDFNEKSLNKLYNYINKLRMVYKESKQIYDFI